MDGKAAFSAFRQVICGGRVGGAFFSADFAPALPPVNKGRVANSHQARKACAAQAAFFVFIKQRFAPLFGDEHAASRVGLQKPFVVSRRCHRPSDSNILTSSDSGARRDAYVLSAGWPGSFICLLMEKPLLVSLGKASYSIYLSHAASERVASALMPPSTYISASFIVRFFVFAGYLAILTGGAVLFYLMVDRFCEKLHRSWRRKPCSNMMPLMCSITRDLDAWVPRNSGHRGAQRKRKAVINWAALDSAKGYNPFSPALRHSSQRN